jgi:hypothetical protein
MSGACIRRTDLLAAVTGRGRAGTIGMTGRRFAVAIHRKEES